MKLITFAVPCYNSAEYMDRCIETLLTGGRRVEIVIIDDGSTDRTPEIADRYAEKYPDIIRVVHQPNGGHGEGANQGLAHASGRYFKVVDSDDWLDTRALHRLLTIWSTGKTTASRPTWSSPTISTTTCMRTPATRCATAACSRRGRSSPGTRWG